MPHPNQSPTSIPLTLCPCTVRSERRPTRRPCDPCKERRSRVPSGRMGTHVQSATSQLLQEARTLISGSVAGKSSFSASLKYIKVGFVGRRFQPLRIGLRANQWYGAGTARAVLLGKREGLRPDGSGASRPCSAARATLCDHLWTRGALHSFGNLRSFSER